MSVHIPSTLKVAQLNVASTAAVGNLKLQDGEGGSWLLYADSYSTKLIANPPASASFELSGDYVNFNLSGCVYSAWIHTDDVRTGSLTVVNNATIVGTLEAYKLKARVLDVSNLDLSNTTLNVSSITVAGAAEINTLSAVQILAEQGAIEQLTVADTLAAKNAMMSELTVIHTLTVHTVEARDKVNAPLIVADRAEFDTLYVNGKAITGSSSGGGGGGEVVIPTDVTLDTLTANETISIPGAQYTNGDIELATDTGIRVGTAGAIEIADAGSNAVVRIDRSGIKALKVSASTASVGALTSSSTVTTQNLTVSNSGVVDGSLTVRELNVLNSINASGATVTNITASSSVTALLVTADEVQGENITATNNITAPSVIADAITTDTIQANGDAQVDGDMSVIGRLDVETLFVNGVEITDNGGEVELPPTIQVSEVQALPPYNVVSIPQMQGMHLTLSGSMGSLSPSAYPPLVLHVCLMQDSDFSSLSEATSLRAESGFRAPVTFLSPDGITQVSPLDVARFTQRTIATACQNTLTNRIDMGDVSIGASGQTTLYCNRAWLEVCPARLNSINKEQSAVTLKADRMCIDNNDASASAVVNGEITGVANYCLNSTAFTLAPESLTACVTRQLPSGISILIYDNVTGEHPAASTLLAYTTDIKTEITPSQFDVEATATLVTYETITDGSLTDYLDNTKARIQLDVSPAAYTSNLTYADNFEYDNVQSGIYVRPNNVIIQAPFVPNIDASYDVPANLGAMGVGLFGRNILLQAESITLDSTIDSVNIAGGLTVSDITKARYVSVMESLSAKSLYVNGTQITPGSTGGSDAEFTTVTTGTVSSASSLDLVAPNDLTINSTAAGISLIAGSTEQLYCKARIAIGASDNIVLDHMQGEKVIIDEHNRSTGATTSSGGMLQLGTLIVGAGETTVIDSSQFNPSSGSGSLKNNKIVIGSSSARIISCIEWNSGDDLLSYLQNEGKDTCVPIHLLFQIFQLRPELQASTTTT